MRVLSPKIMPRKEKTVHIGQCNYTIGNYLINTLHFLQITNCQIPVVASITKSSLQLFNDLTLFILMIW